MIRGKELVKASSPWEAASNTQIQVAIGTGMDVQMPGLDEFETAAPQNNEITLYPDCFHGLQQK